MEQSHWHQLTRFSGPVYATNDRHCKSNLTRVATDGTRGCRSDLSSRGARQLIRHYQERKRKLQNHHRIDDEFEELQLLSYSMADALAHAFQQAGTEYLTNGGIRPPTSWADEDEERSSISSSVRPSMESLHSANEFGVSNNLLSALHNDPGPY